MFDIISSNWSQPLASTPLWLKMENWFRNWCIRFILGHEIAEVSWLQQFRFRFIFEALFLAEIYNSYRVFIYMEQSATSFLFVRLWEDLKKQSTQLKPKVRQKGCESSLSNDTVSLRKFCARHQTRLNFQHHQHHSFFRSQHVKLIGLV